MTTSPLDRVSAALDAVGSRRGSGQDRTCPAHNDHNASLGVTSGDTQPVVLTCKAGCKTVDILKAIGLTWADLGAEMVETKRWTYTDPDGVPLYDVVRREDGTGRKEIRPYPYVGTKVASRPGLPRSVPRVLLDLPEVHRSSRAGGHLVVVEGETSADAINRRKWSRDSRPFATTHPQGATAPWTEADTDAVRGARRVTIVADKDPAGFERAARVHDALTAALGSETKVVVKLSATEGKGHDVVDHFRAGYRWTDLVTVARADLVWNDDASSDRSPDDKLGAVLSRSELASLPRPDPLIDGWLELRTTVVVVGETGSNKSFLVLGWACSVATGTPWLGHAVALQAPVLFVVGEGGSGLDARIAAWEADTGVTVPDDKLVVALGPGSLHGDDEVWEQLTRKALDIGTRLVVFDTLSSLAPDADETKDAALVVRRMTDLARAIDGTTVVVHHSGWTDKGRARGGSQLESNPDSVIVLEKRGDEADTNPPVSVRRKKSKESEAGLTVHVERQDVGRSCVLVQTLGPPPRLARKAGDSDAERRDRALRAVDDAPFTLTVSKLGEQVGGNFASRSRVIEDLLESGSLVLRRVQALEGSRSVVRERIGRPEEGPQPAPPTENAR